MTAFDFTKLTHRPKGVGDTGHVGDLFVVIDTAMNGMPWRNRGYVMSPGYPLILMGRVGNDTLALMAFGGLVYWSRSCIESLQFIGSIEASHAQ